MSRTRRSKSVDPAEPIAKPKQKANGNGVSDRPKKPTGRPSSYTQTIADALCAELRKGRTLRSITEQADMPSRDCVFDWAEKYPAFGHQYARSLQEGLDVLAEETVDIAEAYIKPEDVPAARHKFDVRRWYLGKRSPKRWGDKAQLEVTGEGGGPVTLRPRPCSRQVRRSTTCAAC